MPSHAAIDGTGWVRRAVDRTPHGAVGQIFWMGCTTRVIRTATTERSIAFIQFPAFDPDHLFGSPHHLAEPAANRPRPDLNS